MPEGDTLFRTAAGLRPHLVSRDLTAARAQGPGRVPQEVQRLIGRRIDAVESLGKNLLIRFDGGPERITTTGDRAAPGALYVYGRQGRPCRRCGTRIASTRQGRDLPRTTYWCPTCQGGAR